jgi:hypothetical protein
MSADPRWLEILKASGGQSASLACACATFLLIVWIGWITPPFDWVVSACVFGLLVSSFLAMTSLVTSTLKAIPVHKWAVRWFYEKRDARALEKHLVHLTDRERNILGYLLYHNQKMFTAAQDGGHAITLISRGYIVRAMKPGQGASGNDVPMAVPDHVWDMLVRHKSELPYKPPPKSKGEPRPWRVHWMAQ